MKNLLLAVAVTFSVVADAAADDRVLGLLSLPEVFGSGPCAKFTPQDVPLFSAPNNAQPIAVIRVDQQPSFAPHGGCEGLEVSVHMGKAREELPTREYDYEMPAAIVLDRRDGWFKIRLRDDRSAWLKASAIDRFMPLSDLFEEFAGLTAINSGFTGRLLAAPAALAGPILPRVTAAQPVRVVEIRERAGQSWLQVEVLSNSACTAGAQGPPEVIATGWLPMHMESGEPTVWFSSRGC
ncbi:MAG TPA: hypothetical protein VEC39_19290 [Vicinamibacterales bacterium]|nr:hypothetical protein [Vicinamibacterales bacterium]